MKIFQSSDSKQESKFVINLFHREKGGEKERINLFHREREIEKVKLSSAEKRWIAIAPLN